MQIKPTRYKLLLLLLALLLAVAASGCGNKHQTTQSASVSGEVENQFDMTVRAFKKDQFQLQGAVLSSQDLASHLAYLADQGKLPATVLLQADEKGKIRKQQLADMADMAYRYNFAAYQAQDNRILPIIAQPAE